MNEKLVAFLYILCRDELPMGKIETLIQHHIEYLQCPPKYSSPELVAMARKWAERLK